ncbi:hypothetical protein AVEN_237173-1 [Araneus ventricosus]|uniref:Uncharacterized protein n=1 Tax=Araneus ventricosus TaxID=182803 RepID=A0A4Y2TC25_ARAVE|nr:hypothetical protein AVEN_237173-1 [Araneus ventricosus]
MKSHFLLVQTIKGQSYASVASFMHSNTMCLAEYIQTVRVVLESLPPPKIILLGEDKEEIKQRSIHQVKDIIRPRGSEILIFHSFLHLDPLLYDDHFKNVSRQGLLWAV